MANDKKNEGGLINFSLIKKPGQVSVNHTRNATLIEESLNFYNSLLHLHIYNKDNSFSAFASTGSRKENLMINDVEQDLLCYDLLCS